MDQVDEWEFPFLGTGKHCSGDAPERNFIDEGGRSGISGSQSSRPVEDDLLFSVSDLMPARMLCLPSGKQIVILFSRSALIKCRRTIEMNVWSHTCRRLLTPNLWPNEIHSHTKQPSQLIQAPSQQNRWFWIIFRLLLLLLPCLTFNKTAQPTEKKRLILITRPFLISYKVYLWSRSSST